MLPTWLSVVLGACGVAFLGVLLFTSTCRDERPTVDERVGTYGKSLGEAKEQATKDPSEADNARVARLRFVASSQVQLGVMATEIESRSRNKNVPIERIENLRKDYWLLVELREQVIHATSEEFDDALNQFEAQVDTIREQLARVDRGQLP